MFKFRNILMYCENIRVCASLNFLSIVSYISSQQALIESTLLFYNFTFQQAIDSRTGKQRNHDHKNAADGIFV